jgi:hypothetical protein
MLFGLLRRALELNFLFGWKQGKENAFDMSVKKFNISVIS